MKKHRQQSLITRAGALGQTRAVQRAPGLTCGGEGAQAQRQPARRQALSAALSSVPLTPLGPWPRHWVEVAGSPCPRPPPGWWVHVMWSHRARPHRSRDCAGGPPRASQSPVRQIEHRPGVFAAGEGKGGELSEKSLRTRSLVPIETWIQVLREKNGQKPLAQQGSATTSRIAVP